MKHNKLFLMFSFILLFNILSVTSAPFNLPISWILNNDGVTIDENGNGWPDYADNVLNATYAGISSDSILLNGENSGYYLNYDNMNNGSISNEYIDGSDYWDAKGSTGTCIDGYYINEITSSDVVCVKDEDTTYLAGDYLNLDGITFSVDTNDLENNINILYQNITNLPTCSGDDKLTFNGTHLICDDDKNTNTQLSTNQVQDYAWDVLTGLQDGISVYYNSTTNKVDFTVDNIVYNLSDMDDINLSTILKDQILLYDNTTNMWYNQNMSYFLDNYYTQLEIDDTLLNHYLKTEVYNESEIDDILLNYYTQSEIDTTLLDYYTQSEIDTTLLDYYTSTQVDGLDVSTFNNDAGYISDYTVTSDDVTQHQSDINITESQITDLQSYLTEHTWDEETNNNIYYDTGNVTVNNTLNVGDLMMYTEDGNIYIG
jgi:hypothetical protein